MTSREISCSHPHPPWTFSLCWSQILWYWYLQLSNFVQTEIMPYSELPGSVINLVLSSPLAINIFSERKFWSNRARLIEASWWVRSQPLPGQSLPMTSTTIWHPLPVPIITRWQLLPLTTITDHHYQVSLGKKIITSHHYHMATTTIWRSIPHDNHYHMTTTTILPKLLNFL